MSPKAFSALRVSVVSLAAIGLLSLGSPPAAASPLEVVIDEIHYHPSSDCEEEEFIELHNYGPDDVDISGWKFREGVPFVFPAGTVAGAGD